MYGQCSTAESDIGMLYYLTDISGTGGRLKKTAQDFVVREISDAPAEVPDGKFTIADITTTNWETNRLIRLLARTMRISRERIGFAGTKDKRAVTTQKMSFECEPAKLDLVELKDIEISNPYRSNHPIRMGDLLGNGFEITVRDYDMSNEMVRDTVSSVTETVDATGGFPNYFGVQRFGTSRPVTHLVGERIIRGDLKGAVDTYLFHPSEFEEDDVKEAREALRKCDGDYSSIDFEMPKIMGFEKILVDHLMKRPDDYRGAIAEMPSNLQMMFTHAYQSYLYNLMLSGRMERGLPLNTPVIGDTVIPLDGDGVPMHDEPVSATAKNIKLVERQVKKGRALVAITVYGSDGMFSEGEMGEIERKVISDAGLDKKDFIVPGLGNCSAKGNWREILCPVKDLRYDIKDDCYSMMFSLSKGNYATCLMREFLKTDMNRY